MKNKNMIAICGHAGSGKDTLAAFFVQQGYTNYKFSKPVKDLVSDFLGRELNKGTDREMIIDASWYMKGSVAPGEILKKHGSDFLFFLNDVAEDEEYLCESDPFTDEFWANKTLSEISSDEKAVFTDIRLPSEYNAVKELGGIFIKIVTPIHICEDRLIKRDGSIMKGIWDSPFEKHFLEWEYDIVVDSTDLFPFSHWVEKAPEKIYSEVIRKLENLNGTKESI